MNLASEVFIEPPNIYCTSDVHDFDFSPANDQIVLSLSESAVEIYSFSPEKTQLSYRFSTDPRPARLTRFSPSGQQMVVGGQGLLMFDIEKFSEIARCSSSSDPYECCFIGENILATSFDNGSISVADTRTFETVYGSSFPDLGFPLDHDFIFTHLLPSKDRTYLFAPASNGTLYTFDLRRPAKAQDKLLASTGGYEEELTCVASLPSESQLICGTATGHLQLYKWGLFGHFADLVKTPAAEVVCMATVDEETLAVGGDDGCVQLWRFNPHRIYLLEPHASEEDDHLPVEHLAISRCKRILASIAHDRAVKFYDLTELGTFDDQSPEERFIKPRGLRKGAPGTHFFNDIG